MNGSFVKGREVFRNQGPKYQCYAHGVALDDLVPFRQGRNALSTGESAKGHQGMEAKWRG
jgi:hypothetical protein